MMRTFIEAAADWLEGWNVSAGMDVSRAMRDLVERLNPDARAVSRRPLAALDYLDQAMIAPDAAAIAVALKPVAESLPWTMAPSGKLTRHMEGRYTFTSLIGPNELIHSDTIRFGAFLVAPDTVYPSHWHAAEEIYMIVSGTARWNVDDCAYAEVPPGSIFRHKPWQPHATTTLSEPMLALWAWHGDIRTDQYGIETDEAEPDLSAAGLFSVSPN